MRVLGVLTPTAAEAAWWERARGAAVRAFASGGDGERAREGAERLAADGVAGLVSVGHAAGLAPAARPGVLVLAESVVLPTGEALATDGPWREDVLERLTAAGLSAMVARAAGRDRLLASSGEKRAAFRAAFAASLDTESHAVALAAQAAALPFLVLRAVADPVEESRPAALGGTSGDDGLRRSLALAARLAGRPWEIGAFWRQRRLETLAGAALRRAAPLIAPPPGLSPAAPPLRAEAAPPAL